MREGAVVFVMDFPHPWPPANISRQTMRRSDGAQVDVSFWPDGRLSAQAIGSDGNVVASGMSQPLHVVGAGLRIMVVSWANDTVVFRVDGRQIYSWTESSEVHVVEGASQETHEQHGALAFMHPDVRLRCQRWMAHRAAHYMVSAVPAGRELVSLEEDLSNLRDVALGVRDCVASIVAGNRHHVSTLRGKLRELIYEEFDRRGQLKKNYAPLLLRVAARLDLPLPMFALMPDAGSRPNILDQADVELRLGPFGIRASLPTQELMDLQEWMSHSVFASRLSSTDFDYSAGGLVAKSAATLGGAHYDPAVPKDLKALDQSGRNGTSLLTAFLLDVATLVVDLSEYVLDAGR